MCSAHERPRTPACAAPTALRAMLNPLRSESEAFRLLLYVVVVFAVIIALVVILRAIL
jgi:hypothetical protein